tara:strand:- start:3571 stop:5358 length:1788 start_codon:yes stop_codon:yes gene_type:complete
MAFKLRRGTNAQRLTITPAEGELIYTTDTKKLYAGDGTTIGGNLISGLNNVIEDTSPQLGGDLDLAGNNIIGNGNINITGNITATGDINIGDGTEDSINVGGLISSNLIPNQDEGYNIGSSAKRWNAGWFSGLNVTGQADIEAVNANIIGDDSNLAYDKTNNEFRGTFIGNLIGSLSVSDFKGSVFSDDSTLLVDGVNSTIPAANISGALPAIDGSNLLNISAANIIGTSGNPDGTDVQVKGGQGTSNGGDVYINGGNGSTTQGSVIIGNGTTRDVQITNVVIKDGVMKGTVTGDDSTILVDGVNSKLYLANNSLTDLGDVLINQGDSTSVQNGEILVYDTRVDAFRPVQLFPDFETDFTVMKGHLDGTFQGTILSDDSTMILDGFTKSLANISSITASTISTTAGGEMTTGELTAQAYTGQKQGQVTIKRKITGTISDNRPHGVIRFEQEDDAGEAFHSIIQGGKEFVRIANHSTGFSSSSPDTHYMSWAGNKLGLGYRVPPGDERLQVSGDVDVTGYIQGDGLRLEGNAIKGTRSNDNITLDPNGTGTVELVVPVQTTVGSAGSAASLPAQPSTYFKINVAGTEYVVPAYAVS